MAPAEPSLYEGEVLEPRHLERVPGPGGTQWKLTCLCGKRILAPLQSDAPTGRCPKCGRRLRLPGYKPHSADAAAVAGEPPVPPARPVPAPPERAATSGPAPEKLAAPPVPPRPSAASPVSPSAPAAAVAPDEEMEMVVLDAPAARRSERPSRSREHVPNRDAAIRTADLLRAHMSSGSRPGLVSAWPMAAPLPRALAGFIDLTLGMVATMAVVVLGSAGVLPESSRNVYVVLAAFFSAELVNDCLLEAWGGTLGRRLVVLTLRDREGHELAAGRVVLRGVLKWLLIPGWLLALFDPGQRALHDLICGTRVLKGRARG